MKRPLAALCAFIVMGGMLWTGLRRPGSLGSGTPVSPHEDNPVNLPPVLNLSGASDRIEALLDAAQRGDVAGYLASFGGPLRARLEREADDRGRAAFAAELRRAAGARKSHAIFAPLIDGESLDAAEITIESTFVDRIERQTYHLARGDAGWLITDVETARERIPKNRLGSLATFQEPEGVPVPIDETRIVPTTHD